MKTQTFYKVTVALAAILFLAAAGITTTSGLESAGPFLIGLLIAVGISFRGFPQLKGFSYTVMIFSAVTTALYYPSYFIEMNGFKFTALITH